MGKKEFEDALSSIKELQEYLCKKAKNHNNFNYYSTLNRIEGNFLKYNSVFLSDGSTWNDSNDSKRFNNSSEYKRYGICFSFSKSESVAMWMLYGGLDDDGAMIKVPKALINEIISTTYIEVGYWNIGKFEKTVCLSEGFSVIIQDVVYFGKGKKGKKYVKRSTDYCDGVSEISYSSDCILRKSMSWAYENEVRLIVSVDTEHLMKYEKEKCSTVRIPFRFKADSLKEHIVLSPNYKGEKKGYSTSCLDEELNWDFCKSCLIKRKSGGK